LVAFRGGDEGFDNTTTSVKPVVSCDSLIVTGIVDVILGMSVVFAITVLSLVEGTSKGRLI
jgi:hypothetical protein